MKIFTVTYDLRNDRDYDRLYNRLEDLGGIRVLESTWTLKLADINNCKDVMHDLCRYIDKDDGMYIAYIKSSICQKPDNEPHRYKQ